MAIWEDEKLDILQRLNIFEKQASKIDKIIGILIFLDMIFIGSDRISIHAGVTFRFVQILLLITVILVFATRKLEISMLAFFCVFFATNILSTVFSYDLKSSVLYLFWDIYNYVAVFLLFYSWSKGKTKEVVIDIWLLSFAVQSIYVFIEYIMAIFHIDDPFFYMAPYAGILRPAIWFYEPSFLATYFSIFLLISFYLYVNLGTAKYRNYTIISYAALLVTSSSTGFLSIGLNLLLVVIFTIAKFKKEKAKRFGIIVVVMIALFGILYTISPDRYNVFIGRMLPKLQITHIDKKDETKKQQEEQKDENKQIIDKIADSSIGQAAPIRVQGWRDAAKVFKDHPIIGIGPNAYPKYSKTDMPPTNVTFELLVNLGVIGFLAFIIPIIYILIKAWRDSDKYDYYAKILIVSAVAFIIVLQANQNYMRLYAWMQMGIVAGCCFKDYKNKKSIN